jgi:hypothetical protein
MIMICSLILVLLDFETLDPYIVFPARVEEAAVGLAIPLLQIVIYPVLSDTRTKLHQSRE